MKFLIGICLFLLPVSSHSQYVELDTLEPRVAFDNIHVQKLAGDSLVSSFVIWIKKEVPLHYHADHSEHVLMLAGEGVLTLNGQEIHMKVNTWVFIPKGSRHSFRTTSGIPAKVLSIQAPEFVGKDRVRSD